MRRGTEKTLETVETRSSRDEARRQGQLTRLMKLPVRPPPFRCPIQLLLPSRFASFLLTLFSYLNHPPFNPPAITLALFVRRLFSRRSRLPRSSASPGFLRYSFSFSSPFTPRRFEFNCYARIANLLNADECFAMSYMSS